MVWWCAARRVPSLLFCSIVISCVVPFAFALKSRLLPTVRDLALGDFAIVNEAFKDFRLAIDLDEPIELDAGLFGTISIELNNLICYDISIGDVLLSYAQPTETSLNYDINVVQFDTECEFDYTYQGRLLLSGGGSAVLLTSNNFFNVEALFSQIAVGIPPNGISFNSCVTGINVVDSTFVGGIVASVLNINIVKERIRDVIANLVEEYICEEALLLEQKAAQLLTNLTALIDPYLQPSTNVDVLEPEKELYEISGPTPDLINLLEPNGTIAFGLSFLLDQVTKALNLEIDDENSPTGTGKDLGANVFIRSLLLDEDRNFFFNTSSIEEFRNGTIFETTAGNMANIEISIDSVRISGIDTLTRVGPIEKVSNYTIMGSFSWNYIEISADVYIAFGPPDGTQKVEESILISTTIQDLDLAFGMLLGVKEGIGDIKVGEITETTNILPCLFDNIEALNISSLNMSLGSIDDIVIEDFESPGLARVLDSLFQGLYELYDDGILVALPVLFQTVVRSRLNALFPTFISESECTSLQTTSGGELVDFRDFFLDPSKAIEYGGKGTAPYGDVGTLLRTTIDDVLNDTDPNTGSPEINNIIASFLGLQSGIDGTIIFNTTLIDIIGRLQVGNVDAKFLFQAGNLRIENVDTVLDPIVLLEPQKQSGQQLFNNVGFGVTNRPLRVTSKLIVEIETNGIQSRDEIEIAFDLVGARLSLTILAKILANRLFFIPIIDIFEVNCWLATVPAPFLNEQGIRLDGSERTLGIVDTELMLENLNLKIDCTNCNSAALLELSDFVQSEEASDTFTRLATTLFHFVTTLLDGEFLQTFIDRAVSAAPVKCPHSPTYDPEFKGFEFDPFEKVDVPDDSVSFLLFLTIGILGVLLLILIFRVIMRCLVRDQYRRWMKTTPSTNILRIYENQKNEDKKIVYLNDNTRSMIQSQDVPLIVRYGIPVMILLNIALFLSAHFNLGGAISVFIEFADKEIAIKNLFEFSIARSAIQLWEAGAIELSILLMLFSIIWPYAKQLITLIAWFLPPRMLNAERRGSIFTWLDFLAKWSSVDIFFLVVSLVAFNIKVDSPDKVLPQEFYKVDVLLVPLWGLYANLIAQVLSQLSSHVAIYYHRKSVKNAMARMERDQQQQRSRGAQDETTIQTPQLENQVGHRTGDVAEALYQHHFLKSHYRGEHLSIRAWVNAFIVVSIMFILALIFIGSMLPSFSFEQLGIVGILVEFGLNSSEATTNFGVLTTVKTLLEQGQTLGTTLDMIGMGVISIFVLLTLVIVPMILTCALAYLWFRPMNKVKRGRVQYLIEILSAWQYIEVYLIAVMVSSWQLSPTSEYLINSYCAGLADAFTSLVNNGVMKAEDAQCFKLRGSVEGGFLFLLAAAFVLAFFNTFVMQAVLQQNYDAVSERQNLISTHAHSTTTIQHFATGVTLDEVTKSINLASLQFTDIFPCFLQRAFEKETVVGDAVRSEEVDNMEVKNLSNQNIIRKMKEGPTQEALRPETNEDPGIEV